MKNIFLIVSLFVFTVVSFFLVNFMISVSPELFTQVPIQDIFFYFFLPIILFFILLFILLKDTYKKNISEKYLYAYICFIILLILFYFGYFSHISNIEKLNKSYLDTKLTNIEVSNEENGLIKLGDFLEKNKGLNQELDNLKVSFLYECIINNDCEDIDKEKTFEKIFKYIENNSQELNLFNKELKELSESKYFKFNTENDNYISYVGISIYSKFSLIQSIYYFDNFQKEKALDILNTYFNLSEKMINGDLTFIGMIVSYSVNMNLLSNIDYISDNYNLDKNTNGIQKIKNILSNEFNPKDLFDNSVKVETLNTLNSVDNQFKSSLLFGKQEFFNLYRNWIKTILEENKYFYEKNKPNFFTREYIYYKMFYTDFYLNGYLEDLNELKEKRKEILEKLK